MTCVLWLIQALYVSRSSPTKPLQGEELWSPVRWSEDEGAGGRQSLQLALVPSLCRAARTVVRHTHNIHRGKCSVNYVLKGRVVLQLRWRSLSL